MRILKYGVSTLAGSFDHIMPEDARIMCVQSQANEPKMWVMVDEGKTWEERRTFQTVMTGQIFHLPAVYRYVGTFQINSGSFVGHVFEISREE